MENLNFIDKAREMARLCLECIYGNAARPEHDGLVYKCIKNCPEAECPFWKIYQATLDACEASATACA